MVCTHCGRESDSASRVCPYCGRYMGTEAYAAPTTYADEPPAPEPEQPRAERAQRNKRRDKRIRHRRVKYDGIMINWAMVALAAAALVLTAAVAGLVYLRVTPAGQRVMARMGRKASADAYWEVGTEYLDQGYIVRAIEAYNTALAIEPEREDLVDKLLLQAEAYEAGGMQDEAMAIFERIYGEVAPKSPVGYRNAIRLLMSQDKLFPAIMLMQSAYAATGDESFYNQRSQLVPKPPTASLSGGRYLLSRTVSFSSPQGYDIYYTTGNEELPERGTLYTGPITLQEGTHNFRAVCMASRLFSDETSVSYTITLPTPLAPKATLAQGEYARAQNVRLRNMNDAKMKITMYYTIDGSKPTLDSPRYRDEPIRLKGGRMNLRAIAVNEYGKVSNELNVTYRINVPRRQYFKEYFRLKDSFAEFTLMSTTLTAFTAKYGEPDRREEGADEDVTGSVARLYYPWGEARFMLADGEGLLYMVHTSDAGMAGPRGSRIGMALDEVTALFRDMGQVANDKGDRGIYYDVDAGYARYLVHSDDPNQGTLTYVSTVRGEDEGTTMLLYEIRQGRVADITLRHVTRRLSNVW